MFESHPFLAAAVGTAQSLTGSGLQTAPDIGSSFFRMCGSLAIVFAVLMGVKWALKKWQGANIIRKTPKLKVLESRAVGTRQALLVVGYNNERMLLASTPQGITLVSKLPEEAETEFEPLPMSNPTPAQSPFAAALMEVISTRFSK